MKIALVGTTASKFQAPFDDPDWKIWACSPGNVGQLSRWDAWFQPHAPENLEQMRHFLIEEHDKPIYMRKVYPEFPSSVAFPFDEMVAEFGDKFFSSVIAWMLAYAITLKPEAVGIWGVDMACEGEYQEQRWGCWHFLDIAKERGIKTVLPPASKLNVRPKLYALETSSPLEAELRRRKEALQVRLEDRRNDMNAAHADVEQYIGALTLVDDILRAECGG